MRTSPNRRRLVCRQGSCMPRPVSTDRTTRPWRSRWTLPAASHTRSATSATTRARGRPCTSTARSDPSSGFTKVSALLFIWPYSNAGGISVTSFEVETVTTKSKFWLPSPGIERSSPGSPSACEVEARAMSYQDNLESRIRSGMVISGSTSKCNFLRVSRLQKELLE